MKFNKSAESDFWYVGDDKNNHIGKIRRNSRHFYLFECEKDVKLYSDDLLDIAHFVRKANLESGIDTTSTFKSNSELT